MHKKIAIFIYIMISSVQVQAGVSWSELTAEQQKRYSQIKQQWDKLPPYQQEALKKKESSWGKPDTDARQTVKEAAKLRRAPMTPKDANKAGKKIVDTLNQLKPEEREQYLRDLSKNVESAGGFWSY